MAHIKMLQDCAPFKKGDEMEARFAHDQATTGATMEDGKSHRMFSVPVDVWVPSAGRYLTGQRLLAEGLHCEVVA